MTIATKAKPALFSGKGKLARETAMLQIATLSYQEDMSRAASLDNMRKVLGASPSEALVKAAKSEWIIGRVASRLPVAELPRGKTSPDARLTFARYVVLECAFPVKDDGTAPKMRAHHKARRTQAQHKVVRAAEEACSKFFAELGLSNAKTNKQQNDAKAAKRAPSMAGSGKGKAAPAAPSHAELVKPAAPVTADDVLAYLGTMARTMQDYVNKHAKICPIDAGTAVQAFRGDILKAANALQERKAIAAAAKADDKPAAKPAAKRRAKA